MLCSIYVHIHLLLGTSEYLYSLPFPQLDDFTKTARSLWIVNGSTAGYIMESGSLSYLINLGGSHMVPMDTPKEALDMVYRFTNEISFADEYNHFNFSIPDTLVDQTVSLKVFTITIICAVLFGFTVCQNTSNKPLKNFPETCFSTRITL